MVRKKNDSIYSGRFDSAAKQIATGSDAYTTEKDGVRAALTDSGVVRIELSGSTISVDTRHHLISLNGAPATELNKAPESERQVFNRYAGGAVDFGLKRDGEGVTIHENFASTVIDAGDTRVLLSKMGPLSYGVAVSRGDALYSGPELSLPAPRYDALVNKAEATSGRS